jgi:hypothetical protein
MDRAMIDPKDHQARSAGAVAAPSTRGGANTDAYVWSGGLSGAWGDAANWTDITTGADPASAPPGATNAVTVNGSSGGTTDITGTGASASLTLDNSTELDGQFTTGALAFGGYCRLRTAARCRRDHRGPDSGLRALWTG